jgi:hypothetical protein
MAGTSEQRKKASESSFMMCKGCDGKGYKEEYSSLHGAMARWECSTCHGAGRIELPDYPLIVIPDGMYRCGLCSMYGDEKGTCVLGVRGDRISPDDHACFRISEFFIGENVDGNRVPQS